MDGLPAPRLLGAVDTARAALAPDRRSGSRSVSSCKHSAASTTVSISRSTWPSPPSRWPFGIVALQCLESRSLSRWRPLSGWSSSCPTPSCIAPPMRGRAPDRRGDRAVQRHATRLPAFRPNALPLPRSEHAPEERSLYPGLVAVVLAIIGVVARPGAAVIHAVLVGLSVDLSFSTNGLLYPLLLEAIPLLSVCARPRSSARS